MRSLLAVGGLDPSGGAGILADCAAARTLGMHPAAVAAVTTVQNGMVFIEARAECGEFVRHAIESVLDSQDVAAVKTGALGTGEIVGVIAELAKREVFPPLVIDPVLHSSSGGVLLDGTGVSRLRDELMPLADVITPNASEVGVLSGMHIEGVMEGVRAAERLVEIGAKAVLLKGGHLAGNDVTDFLVRPNAPLVEFRGQRLQGGETRGTGCVLATLIAGHLASSANLDAAIETARSRLLAALARAALVGIGPRVLQFGRT